MSRPNLVGLTFRARLDRYPKLKDAALIVAYENGTMMRHGSEEAFLSRVADLINSDGYYPNDLAVLDAFLSSLTDEELTTVAAGDQDEAWDILSRAPEGVRIGPDSLSIREAIGGVLNDIFELPSPPAPAYTREGSADA